MIIPTPFHVTQSNSELSSHSGLALLGNILQACEFMKRIDTVHLARRPHPELPHGDVLGVMTALIFIGKPDYDAVKPFQDDLLLRKALGLKRVPSPETLRNRLDLADNHFDEAIRDLSVDIVRRFGTLTPCWEKHVPLDLDVSPFDNSGSHKEGVSRTYKGVDGYAPFMAYIGLEGYLVNAELREGKAHCQRDGDEFLRESIRQARKITDAPLLVRLDSGNDALDNIKVCVQEFVDWLIKRNLRNEDPQWWLETAQRCGAASQPRPGKTVWIGSVYVERDNLTLRIVFEVTQRTTDHHGQILLLPKLDVNTWWTSLTCAEKDVIRLYHDHGTSEQFHSELKGDMDLERLPSGKFATNNLILLLGMFAYNALRLIGQRSLLLPGPCRKEAQRRRLRSVLQDLIYVACRVVSHAHGWYLSFGRNNRWFPILADLHAAFR